MAWTCSGRTNAELVDKMVKSELINSSRVAEAMRLVDRKHYVPDKTWAYEDSPQRIGFGATISAPHMHAHACENLLPLLPEQGGKAKGGAILDVGSGSGYLTAVLHRLSPNALVVGIDHIEGLVEQSITNLKKDGMTPESPTARTQSGIVMLCGDGRKGCPEYAPFSVIHVGAAAPEIPQPLVEQLARPGRMFIPVGGSTTYGTGGDDSQNIWQVDKDTDGNVTKKKLFGVRYVPLTDADRQLERAL
ncbi:protein-L-isoaspartate O-methyltransferase [Kwoniella sp. DSM 27419]